MRIRNLNIHEFETFVSKNDLGNYYQTYEYACLMKENGYDYEFIGLVNEYDTVLGASLILIKKLTKHLKYGYAPKGFVLDYFNKELVKEFTNRVISYYQKKLTFIKINPEIAISEINAKTKEKIYNQNMEIKNILLDLGYEKLKDNLYFESQIPKYNGVVHLRNFSIENLEKNTRNKIKRGNSKGLFFEISDYRGIDILYNFIKRKKSKNALYYKKYYRTFKNTNNVDVVLVGIDTNDFLIQSKNSYEKELEHNSLLAKCLTKEQNEKNINKKMNSDRTLLSYKNDILNAQTIAKIGQRIYIAGALVIKYKNRISIAISGYDIKYKRFNPNYYLHYQIFNYYKKYFEFADINGLTGDFSSENPYKGLNTFKLGFKPKIYEFIGEYDLILNHSTYKRLLKNGKLAKVFNKNNIKKKRNTNS